MNILNGRELQKINHFFDFAVFVKHCKNHTHFWFLILLHHTLLDTTPSDYTLPLSKESVREV